MKSLLQKTYVLQQCSNKDDSRVPVEAIGNNLMHQIARYYHQPIHDYDIIYFITFITQERDISLCHVEVV